MDVNRIDWNKLTDQAVERAGDFIRVIVIDLENGCTGWHAEFVRCAAIERVVPNFLDAAILHLRGEKSLLVNHSAFAVLTAILIHDAT